MNKILKSSIGVLVFVITWLSMFEVFSQVNMTKIKDASITGTKVTPLPGAVLELESKNRGFLVPRMTTADRDLIPIANYTDGLLIYNTTTGCFNHWSAKQNIWLSLCGTLPPALITITGEQCQIVKSNGSFKQGNPLTFSNFLTIPVTVTNAGNYSVTCSSNNGYYFSTSGTFPKTGSYTLNLPGTGTPYTGYKKSELGDELAININGTLLGCKPRVFVEQAAIDYSVDCITINPGGKYFIGVPLSSAEKLKINVNVTSPGFWNINSNIENGFSFGGSGNFTTTGAHSIELTGSGTPIASGINKFKLSSNALSGSTCSDVAVTVDAVSYIIDCAMVSQIGIYKQDIALNSSNKIRIPIDVKATGQTTISTNEVNGMTFTSGLIDLTTLGIQNIILNGSGKPVMPGMTSFEVNGKPGLKANCKIDLSIESQSVAYFMNCGGITANGNYAPGSVMNSSNTMSIPVDVKYIGNYNISTETKNGVSFSGSGVFTSTGVQTILLQASGRPEVPGTISFNIKTNSAQAQNCTKSITFIYRDINVLGLGSADFQPAASTGSQSSRAILESSKNFSMDGTIKINKITLVDGAFSQGNALKDLINKNKIDIIVIGYSYSPDAQSIAYLDSFVRRKKGVLIYANESSTIQSLNLVNAIYGADVKASSSEGYINNIKLKDISDPLLDGPFGNIRGKDVGNYYEDAYYYHNLPSTATVLAAKDDPVLRAWAFKHNTLGFVVIGDSGWCSGNTTGQNVYYYPAKINTAGVPVVNTDYKKPVYNSFLYANTMAWAIKYAQANTIRNFEVTK